MKKAFYISLLIGIGINFCFSQTVSEKQFGLAEFDSTKHNRIYQIQVEDYQIVELIEFLNIGFKGTLINSVWTRDSNGFRKDRVIQKNVISNSIAEKLITELKHSGFENLKNCIEVENCISGLDGTTTSFKSIKGGKINSAFYWELESDYYYNQDKVKLPTEVIKARKLISIINAEFDLNELFNDFLSKLPKGSYAYSMLIMTKK